ncbi:MAG: diguanylate cyclase [Pseudomonadota bacterium]
MIRHAEQHNRQEARTRVSNQAADHADALQRNIERTLSVTYALAALVRQGNGTLSNFDVVGREMLSFYPGVSSLSLAPGGIISSVVPLAGNEKAIGQDLLNNPQTKKEASIARKSAKLTLTRPFTLVQGEMPAIGHFPIFLDDAEGKPSFWGFVNAVIRFPDALEAAGLPHMAEHGLDYKLWRIHPDSGHIQIIAASSSTALIDPVEHDLELPSGNWTLSAAPVEGWGDPLGLSLRATFGLLFSLLLAYAAKLLIESRAHERGLEALVVQRTAEVHAREADLNRAQSLARVGSWVLDFARNEFHGSAEALRIFGVSGGGLFNLDDFWKRVHPDDRNAVDRAWQAARNGKSYDIEYRIVVGGAICWVHSYAEFTIDADGTRRQALGTVQDITERKRVEQAIRDSAESLRLFADNVPAMTSFWDENLRCRFANKVYTEFFGFTADNILGKHLREVIGEESYRETEGHFTQVLQGHPATYQRTRKLANGESRYLEAKLLPHIGDQGKVLGCFAVTTDITEHKLTEERIQRMAHHDSLTGLPNRLLFNDRLEQAISLAKRDSRQFALLYLDLDKFKRVNDTLGHTAGDELLQAVAARIRRQVRESDTVARVGGDEFSVILPDVARREKAETVARKIIAALAAPFQLGSQKQSVDIGTSIGIAVYPADGRDADALIKAADAAMYSAKQVGSSFRFFEA